MTASLVEILGVRHHGPGSARSVRRALDEVRPGIVVIEGPPELDKIAALVASPEMVPPIAGLVYDVNAPRLATFYPLAVFSPEWVALRWAFANGAEIRFGDLAAANSFALRAEDARSQGHDDAAAPAQSDADLDSTDDGENPERHIDVLDPIGALARAAGYDDAERWWEDAIEQRDHVDPGPDATAQASAMSADHSVLGRFGAVNEAMDEFRAALDPALLDRDRLLEREASMRKVLRKAVKDTDDPVVFVCGAFHAPVLHPDTWPTATSDNALLKGLPKTKVAATWAPWTSRRLAFASGYGAGVTAPNWYHHLFTTDDDVVAHWMTDAARLLRDEGYDASAASVVEATRLADALAALRGRPVAGLAEVNDAALTVLGGGSSLSMATIAGDLLVGRSLGVVPPETPMVPLAEDLARQQRSLRLKPSAEQKTVTLDLRKANQLDRSVLLRRLNLLGIAWGVEVSAGRTTGTFKEAWQLEWQPEFAVSVIEASLHGTTIESAAAAKVHADAAKAESLETLASAVESCLLADLPEGLAAVLELISVRTATAPDQIAIMNSVEPLARTTRYGDVRNVDTALVHDVLATMVTRLSVGLGVACASLDDTAATAMRAAIESVDRGVALVNQTDQPSRLDETLVDRWRDALAGLPADGTHGAVAGSVARILLDAGRIDADEASRRLSRALSLAASPATAAAWLDGFLDGDVALLLHDPRVFGLIDSWLSDVDDETFDDLLPLVRRTFSRFEKGERRRIGELVTSGTAAAGPGLSGDDLDLGRARPAMDRVADLLGLSAQVVER